ncbi:MAG: M10 family metallopeptidase C-terminal domain-containing protein, partial [Sphingomonadales bacterium]|nr:M10 family metallopeptidase C-terminal domain-containing protein [Sphingomonadales bacterium]
DWMAGGRGGDTIEGNNGDDEIRGHSGEDSILGGRGSDFMSGGRGEDTLRGEAGNDTLVGGLERDLLHGGEGADLFVFQSVEDSGRGGDLPDWISDFDSGEDRIDLSAIDADTGDSEDSSFTFIGEAAFSETAGELRFEATPLQTTVYADVDGDGVADLVIDMYGCLELTEANFVL